MTLYSTHDDAGWLTYAENRSSFCGFTVDIDHADSFNVLPSRGTMATHDVLPPGTGQPLEGGLSGIRLRIRSVIHIARHACIPETA